MKRFLIAIGLSLTLAMLHSSLKADAVLHNSIYGGSCTIDCSSCANSKIT